MPVIYNLAQIKFIYFGHRVSSKILGFGHLDIGV